MCLAAALLLASCGAPDLSDDQRRILEAIASDPSGSLCLKPLLPGEVGPIWARIPPRGFRDLAEDAGQSDVRLAYGSFVGRIRIAENPDCFTALVPRVSGDRALAALLAPPRHIEFGLRRQRGRWVVVARGGQDI